MKQGKKNNNIELKRQENSDLLQIYILMFLLRYCNSYIQTWNSRAELQPYLQHKTSHKSHRYICSNSQKYTVWVKSIYLFYAKNYLDIK